MQNVEITFSFKTAHPNTFASGTMGAHFGYVFGVNVDRTSVSFYNPATDPRYVCGTDKVPAGYVWTHDQDFRIDEWVDVLCSHQIRRAHRQGRIERIEKNGYDNGVLCYVRLPDCRLISFSGVWLRKIY